MKDGLVLAREVERENSGTELLGDTVLGFLFNEGIHLHLRDPTAARVQFDAAESELIASRQRSPDSEALKAWEGFSRAIHPLPVYRDTRKGVLILRELVKGKPAGHGLHIWLALALCENGNYVEALTHIDEHRKVDRPHTEAYLPSLIRAKALWMTGARDRGRIAFHTVSKLLRADIAASFDMISYHDQLWRLIEGLCRQNEWHWREPVPLSRFCTADAIDRVTDW